MSKKKEDKEQKQTNKPRNYTSRNSSEMLDKKDLEE